MSTADETGTGVAASADDEFTQGAHAETLITLLAFASVAASAIGFLTFVQMTDYHRDRTTASALGLFVATWLGSATGTSLGMMAARRSRAETQQRTLLLGISGAGLGGLTAILNLNWMRTRISGPARIVAAEL